MILLFFFSLPIVQIFYDVWLCFIVLNILFSLKAFAKNEVKEKIKNSVNFLKINIIIFVFTFLQVDVLSKMENFMKENVSRLYVPNRRFFLKSTHENGS